MNALASIIGIVTVAIVVSLLLGCGSEVTTNSDTETPSQKPFPEVDAEIAKLEGKWIAESFHIDGLKDRPSQWYRFSFSGDQMTTETSEAAPLAVKYFLNPNANPKQLDTSTMVDGAEVISKGIYSIDSDFLKLSWRVGGERPTDFESKDRDGKIVLVLRRAQD